MPAILVLGMNDSTYLGIPFFLQSRTYISFSSCVSFLQLLQVLFHELESPAQWLLCQVQQGGSAEPQASGW